jgi:type I restriction enzyme M protein
MSEYNLKSIKANFKKEGIFYTPNELALFLQSLIDIPYKNVYDPTCGEGGLLKVFDDSIVKYGQEKEQRALDNAVSNLINFTGYCGDTLANDMFSGYKFDVVIANPPFSIAWVPPLDKNSDVRYKDAPCLAPKGKADYAFILHCLDKMADNGIAIILNFPGILYRGQSEGKIRQYLIENNYIEMVVHVAGNKFVDTKISTCVLVLKKNKPNTDIIFYDNELNITNTVSIDEVKNNGYGLSVHTYCKPAVEKEVINPVKLEIDARKVVLDLLATELEFSQLVELFGDAPEPLSEFIKQIEELLNKYRTKLIL